MEKQVKNETTTKVSSDIFSVLKGFQNVGTKKESIYKVELFNGKSEKERKSLRRKIRNSRDNMIELFNGTKDIAKRKEIATAWKEFAKKVYADTSIIFEANTTDDKAVIIAKFITEINAITK